MYVCMYVCMHVCMCIYIYVIFLLSIIIILHFKIVQDVQNDICLRLAIKDGRSIFFAFPAQGHWAQPEGT